MIDAALPIDLLFVIAPHSLLQDIAGPAEAFRLANLRRAERGLPPRYRLRYCGPLPTMTTSVGLEISNLEPLPAQLAVPTWVLLVGQPSAQLHHVTPAIAVTAQWLNRTLHDALQAPNTPHRLVTICSGTLLAARAGLLARRRCTTHHDLLDKLRELVRDALVVGNRVFVVDGPVASSAGITAGLDLALHLIAQELGEALASAVAQVMVVFHRRAGDDPERSPLLAGRSHLHPAVHAVQNAVLAAPGEDWSLERLAAVAHVTPRHLARLFREHAGVTPREHVEQVRLALAQQARQAGLRTQQAVDLAGFRSDRQWRRARQRAAGAS
ncbi:MAG: helix-turn-helix domain-containing protein [Burkholderiaceae bacterium]